MKKIYSAFSAYQKFICFAAIFISLAPLSSYAQRYPLSPGLISITAPNSPYYESFDYLDTLGAYWPTGWQGTELGSGANGTYSPSTGTSTSSNLYSFGNTFYSPERALGSFVNSPSFLCAYFGAYFKNNTGNAIDTIQIDFIMEQWRKGGNSFPDSSYFAYSKNRTNLDNIVGWTRANAGTLASISYGGTATALDGNNAANRTNVSVLLTGLSINPGDTFVIRWLDTAYMAGNDGLAIDSFRLVMDPYIAPPSPFSCQWTGNSSTDWSQLGNWSIGSRVPTSIDNVTIPLTANQPVIGGFAANVGTLNIASGATLTLSSSSSVLNITGAFTNSGTLNSSNGTVRFAGSTTQAVPAGSYGKLEVTNAGGLSLGGSVSVTSELKLTSGSLSLGNFDLTMLGSTSTITGNTSARYVITNGTGSLKFASMGSGGRGSVTVPVGTSATSYNPVVFNNTGTSDTYSFRVGSGISDSYSGTNYTPGTLRTSNAVARTWVITEAIAGGSTASVNVQWNAADELSGFSRSTSYISVYNGGWSGTTASAAGGVGPYTQLRTNVSSMGAFGVGSSGQLPVEMIHFGATRVNKSVYLEWTTASELNCDGFGIERSSDGSNFEAIGYVKGSGNSTKINRYAYADETMNVLPPVLYYRLKQVDKDGSFVYSHIINASEKAGNVEPVVYPNPFNAGINIEVAAVSGSEVIINVTDITGKVVYTGRNITTTNNEIVPLAIPCEVGGNMFIVRLSVNGNESIHKLVRY